MWFWCWPRGGLLMPTAAFSVLLFLRLHILLLSIIPAESKRADEMSFVILHYLYSPSPLSSLPSRIGKRHPRLSNMADKNRISTRKTKLINYLVTVQPS
ncbi:hypothetical protein LZ30DRAFT_725100 [Colletotrichum cereale]|nr:hypothetical protein LZ30DRAFT_725100 [Colletotrichum cereale]